MLRFTPTAWAKLLFLRDAGNTEVGGFGIAATDDLLLVTDFQLIEQTCSAISVAFDDTAVAEFFDQQVDQGLHPSRFARIWIHTHPGDSPIPSTTDEETFARVFGPCDWAVMFILARGGQTYCRLQYHSGPPIAVELDMEVDYGQPFAASDQAAWLAEHQAKVFELVWEPKLPTALEKTNGRDAWDFHRERDDGPTTLAHQSWIDERQRQWEEDVAWEEYLQTQEESEYAFHYD
jgi:proteasome lid subunit RPN8/RPN11